MALAAKDLFLQTVTVNKEGRYEVRLPWLEDHPPLPDNYAIAKKRLCSTVKKLQDGQLLETYDRIFEEWRAEGIIEEIPAHDDGEPEHFLPHRPVIKESSLTTKIRPVFDASAHEKNKPSLNHCLEKGPNLIEVIPSVLIRFRERKIGVVSDVQKAFLQISVHETDRNFLKFLWINPEGNEKIFRHKRVVFGVNSSPFLLGATIDHHLSKCLETCLSSELYTEETVQKLRKSFYVDNCVTSVADDEALQRFIRESNNIMTQAMFNLRGWEFTRESHEASVPVLGLTWEPKYDTLSINKECFKEIDNINDKVINKRLILSVTQRIFDPIGFICPISVCPKLLLQRTWETKLKWDDEVDDEIKHVFCEWLKELHHLLDIKIPRWFHLEPGENGYSLHTFVDASKDAYSAVIFIRVVKGKEVLVHLVAAKARVAPLKKLSIPRLELLAATIGARLYNSIRENLPQELESYFWSDSSTVISWIRRKDEWATFVWNRVQEIRTLTGKGLWRHVPGSLNPADLPSRGCTAAYLLKSKWWEGPRWLQETPDLWPQDSLTYDEEEIKSERKKKLVTDLLNCQANDWNLTYFSKYTKTVRMIAWVFRFIHNSRNVEIKRSGALISEEIDSAEQFTLKTVQREVFIDINDKRISSLHPFCDESGLIRLRTRISRRSDTENFRFPIVLPSKHPVIISLIYSLHVNSCHVGSQGLLSLLREKYWILGGRRAVRSVISRCVICKRYDSKKLTVETPSLPVDRVRDAAAFEVVGIDFAGPLYLKTGEKAWVCLFTCAIYRAVHLELTTSLSTPSFMQALRRFVARRGRPKTIYSDNGTNFVGMENAFSRLDWERITEYTSVQRITWRFNPPTASWWGGFWERLVGVLKRLLRKVLGRASLCYEDLVTLLCDCEATINARPLTYVSNDPNELIALTPSMFLRDQAGAEMPDCDAVDKKSLCRRMMYKQKLRNDLRQRFRNEYLGQLKTIYNRKPHRQIGLNEIVLVGDDNQKRVDWPLGRVIELLPGRDSQVRLVRVKTSKGQMLRPVQRIYPLECNELKDIVEATGEESVKVCQDKETVNPEDQDVSACSGVSDTKSIKSRVPDRLMKTTRSGRLSKLPNRFI